MHSGSHIHTQCIKKQDLHSSFFEISKTCLHLCLLHICLSLLFFRFITARPHQAMVSTGLSLTEIKYINIKVHSIVHIQASTLFCLPTSSQSLVQNSRKAGITSAMASTTLGNEELVGFLISTLLHNSVQAPPTFNHCSH